MENTSSPTIKLYLEDSYAFYLNDTQLVSIEEFPKDPTSNGLLFNSTIFHPQGGGQPSDEGEIISQDNNISIKVQSAIYDKDRDVVVHKVLKDDFNSSSIKIYDRVNMKINQEKRMLYAKLHSAGHLLDISVQKVGLNLIPGKGFHFPEGPYVEYSGDIDKNKIPYYVEEIGKVSNELIDSTNNDDITISKFYNYEEGFKQFGTLPTYLPQNKPFRWVQLTNTSVGCPCGGTHVKHIKDIEGIKINKITCKGKLIRVSYSLLSKLI